MKGIAALFLILGCEAAMAQPKPASKPLVPAQKNCEVQVNSDKVIADLNGKDGTFIGNVIVTQCDTKMHADQVHVTTVNGQPDQVVARKGNVRLDSPRSGTATGDNGLYDVPRKRVTLTGHVALHKGGLSTTGSHLTYNVATGEAHMDGTPGAAGADGRVHAVLGNVAGKTP